MKLTKRHGLCQHCGQRPATVTITWEEDGQDSDVFDEDWCDECAKRATDYVRMHLLNEP